MTTFDSEGRGGLRDHLPSHTAPVALRDRVRATLQARTDVRGGRPVRRWAGILAAAAVIFAAGMATGRTMQPAASPAPTARYALLLYGGHESASEAEGSRALEYGRWAAGLAAARFVSGEELGAVVGEYGAQALRPGSSEPVAGFFLIDAPDDATAKAVAQECPHLKYGGRVVLQKLPVRG